MGSRKDVRDAVVAARGALPGLGGRRTAFNRGQVLYRVAEVLEGRRAQFVDEISAGEGLTARAASAVVDAAVDRVVWYAGSTAKISQVLGNLNPVAGPYFNVSAPEPTGVVGVLAPQASSLLGLVSVVAPVIATGNTAVVVTSADRPLPAITFGEVLGLDVPGGVVNLITARTAEVASWLASHRDVNAIDLTGVAGAEGVGWAALEADAAGNQPAEPEALARRDLHLRHLARAIEEHDRIPHGEQHEPNGNAKHDEAGADQNASSLLPCHDFNPSSAAS